MSQLIFDHIGIVVPDLDDGVLAFGKTISAIGQTQRFDDDLLTVSVQFLRDNKGIVYELISPLGEKSIVSDTLRKKKNLLNQLAYIAPDIKKTAQQLRLAGYFPLSRPTPAIAFNGASVQFFLSPFGFVLEIIEQTQYEHEFHPIAQG